MKNQVAPERRPAQVVLGEKIAAVPMNEIGASNIEVGTIIANRFTGVVKHGSAGIVNNPMSGAAQQSAMKPTPRGIG